MSTPLFYTIPEACALIHKGKTALYAAAAAGLVVMVKDGRRSLITAESLFAYANSLPVAKLKPPAPRPRPARKAQSTIPHQEPQPAE
jgi:hypothetical protein